MSTLSSGMTGTRSTNRYSALQSLIADQDTEIEDELAKGEFPFSLFEGSRGRKGVKRTLPNGGCACSSSSSPREHVIQDVRMVTNWFTSVENSPKATSRIESPNLCSIKEEFRAGKRCTVS